VLLSLWDFPPPEPTPRPRRNFCFGAVYWND